MGLGRDRQTDNARDGSKQYKKSEAGFEVDFSPTTVAEEEAAGGWLRTTKPAPGKPARTPYNPGPGYDRE